MKQYFLQVTGYSTANKAHAAMQKVAYQFQDCLTDEQRLNEIKQYLQQHCDRINQEHKRCKDISIITNSFTDHSERIEVEGNFYISITRVSRQLLSDPEAPKTDPVDDRQMQFPYMADVIKPQQCQTEDLRVIHGVIIKHRPSPELYGGVGVSTICGDYAVLKEHQELASQNIGAKVKVREMTGCFKTVEILEYK